MQRTTVTVGPLAAASANNIALAQSGGGAGNLVLNGNLVSGGIATLDVPRTVLITTTDNESSNKFTLQGTDWAGSAITETITGPNNTTGASVLSYKTITKILNSANITANVTVGTTTTAYSQWVRFDDWAFPKISKQVTVTGGGLAGNFTVQQTMDNPDTLLPGGKDPANVTWFSDPDTNFVGQTGNVQGFYDFIPVWARVYLNSGNATVTAIFQQAMSVIP